MIDSHDLPLKNFVVRTVVVSDFKSNIQVSFLNVGSGLCMTHYSQFTYHGL